jgi:peptidoglycan/xylan/chitin deacetylase (PgdA/CDA1 family)
VLKSFLSEHILNSALRRSARLYRSKSLIMRNAAPLVSFTFDDVPQSAFTNGAAILDDQGVRGTFYIAGGRCGKVNTTMGWRHISRDQVRALNEGGHEIGCHTFSHPRVDQIDARAVEDECGRNRDVLRELCAGAEPTNFCYPFGRVSLPRKRQLEERFDSCRGIDKGINAGTVDLGLLKVIQLYDRTLTQDKLQRLLRENRDCNGWLIFYTHDVAEQPTDIGCSPHLLRATVEAVKANEMPCLPIREALVAIGYSSTAR